MTGIIIKNLPAGAFFVLFTRLITLKSSHVYPATIASREIHILSDLLTQVVQV